MNTTVKLTREEAKELVLGVVSENGKNRTLSVR